MSKLVTSAAMFGETENGALTYVTSASKVLDLFAQGGALRTRSESEINQMVQKAYSEDPKLTIATLLYLRDIRGGQGEKRTFRTAIRYLYDTYQKDFTFIESIFDAIVEVGSWKDIIDIFSVDEYYKYVESHWNDNSNLMFKWLPSIGGSSNNEAEYLAKKLGLTPRQYRKYLSKKRAELKLVETSMCKNEWSSINYEAVPSKAGLIYRNAFKKHDEERYGSFIEAATRADGSVKINTGTLAPYQLTEKYQRDCRYDYYTAEEDPTIEAMWKNLPNYCDDSNSIVVADTSGSMTGMPMAISTALAIYFAERNKGLFHNEFITFSRKPRFYQFREGMSLLERVKEMVKLNIVENTDIQATFDLLLKAAIDNHLPEEEMPKNIFIISDMEFDEAQRGGFWGNTPTPKTNYEVIEEKYKNAGYKRPTLIFWNVNSMNNNVPVKQDENGTILVSGSSASTFNMAISENINPYDYMLSVINKPRYKDLAEKIVR